MSAVLRLLWWSGESAALAREAIAGIRCVDIGKVVVVWESWDRRGPEMAEKWCGDCQNSSWSWVNDAVSVRMRERQSGREVAVRALRLLRRETALSRMCVV